MMKESEDSSSEEMIQDLKRLRVLKDHEINCAIRARRCFQNKIQGPQHSKNDFIKYIEYEMDLLKLVRIRRNKLKLNSTKSDLDPNLAFGVSNLFKRAIFQFQNDTYFWKYYLNFCENIPVFSASAHCMLLETLTNDPREPELWKMAATYELEKNDSVEKSRHLLLEGIVHNPDSKLLYKEAFRFELIHNNMNRRGNSSRCSRRRCFSKRNMKVGNCCSQAGPSTSKTSQHPVSETLRSYLKLEGTSSFLSGSSISSSNVNCDSGSSETKILPDASVGNSEGTSAMRARRGVKRPADDGSFSDFNLKDCLAEFLYESASERIADTPFLISMFIIAMNYSFTEKVQTRMKENLSIRYPRDELIWDAMARYELDGAFYDEETVLTFIANQKEKEDHSAKEPISLEINPPDPPSKEIVRQRVRNSCQMYKLGMQFLDTQKIWSLYVDSLFRLNESPRTLRKFKMKTLRNVLLESHKENRLEEKHYSQWAALYPHDEKEMDNVLRTATERFAGSSKLWKTRLHCHMSIGDNDSLMALLKQATKCLGNVSDALDLWKLLIEFYQIRNTSKVEEIFREGISQNSEISNKLKPMFLEWLALSKDIKSARKMYESVCTKSPFCKELHLKMADLENILPEVEMPRILKCYELACEQFGRHDISVWMEFIKFERRRGDKKKVKEVYRRAVSSLEGKISHSFINEFCEYCVIKDL